MKTIAILSLLLCAILLLTGCTGSAFDQSELGAFKEDSARAARAEESMQTPETARFATGSDKANPFQSALAAPQEPAQTAQVTQQRTIIYSAAMRMVVVSVSESLSAVRKMADSFGGYMQEISGDSITVRVPATRFNDAVAAIEKLGEVVDRNVKASDITEQMIDLKIRLENAEKARQRLLELVSKAEKTEDLLKIEEQLARVTTEIEAMKGKIRFFESQAAMSTIRVEFNAPRQVARAGGINLPFEWVNRLGDGLVAGTVEGTPRKPGIFGRGPEFTPPPGFVRYYQSESYVEAMDAADLRIKVQKQPNYDQADLSFWTKLARKVLVESRSLAITSESAGSDISTISGTREIAGKPYVYLLTIRRDRNSVVTFEAWGPQDQFEPQRAAIDAAATRVGRG